MKRFQVLNVWGKSGPKFHLVVNRRWAAESQGEGRGFFHKPNQRPTRTSGWRIAWLDLRTEDFGKSDMRHAVIALCIKKRAEWRVSADC